MTNNQTDNQTQEPKAPALIAWYVSERGEKSFWTRIGAAWDHKDGEGFNLDLDLVPATGGKIVLRTPTQGNDPSGEERT